MHYPQSLQTLIDALKRLPSVGPKTAQRMAFHMLEADRATMAQLAHALTAADDALRDCSRCRNFSEADLCGLCASQRRDQASICVVESPADLVAIEQGGGYNGQYFVLHGRLSPLDGVGPDALGLDALDERLANGEVEELILATSSTVEGEATAHVLAQMARSKGKAVTRIAHGVPMGGELEYVDASTLAHALRGRQPVQAD